MIFIRYIFLLTLLLSPSISFAHAKLQKLTVALDWFWNPNHAPLFVAQSQHFFEKEGLEVEFLTPGNPSDPPKLVAAKKVDVAITYHIHFVTFVSRGLPLLRFATLINAPLDCIIVNAQGTIKNIEDLRGKTVAGGEGSDPLISAMLAHHHLSLKDVKFIQARYALTQALLTDQADAVTGAMRNVEVEELKLAGFKPRVFYPEQEGVPLYDELIFVTHSSLSSDKRLMHFIKALKEATAYLDQHPSEMWQAFAAAHPESNNPLNQRIWKNTLTYFSRDPGSLDPSRYEQVAHFLRQRGIIQKKPLLKDYTSQTS